ncbi:hypothetical protein CLCAR_3267 [Clostridium carboxidivorans P7]|nr:hypothetical protein CLCAR_3267 [Clostridium carboxidivorans P7]
MLSLKDGPFFTLVALGAGMNLATIAKAGGPGIDRKKEL